MNSSIAHQALNVSELYETDESPKLNGSYSTVELDLQHFEMARLVTGVPRKREACLGDSLLDSMMRFDRMDYAAKSGYARSLNDGRVTGTHGGV